MLAWVVVIPKIVPHLKASHRHMLFYLLFIPSDYENEFPSLFLGLINIVGWLTGLRIHLLMSIKDSAAEIPGAGLGVHRHPQRSRDSQNPVLEPFIGDFTEEAQSQMNWVWDPAKPVCTDSFLSLCVAFPPLGYGPGPSGMRRSL